MGKPSPSGGIDPQVQQGMLANQSALVEIAKGQAANADTLFGTAFPGFQQAEDFYQTLQSGDPAAILRAIAPTAQASTEAAAGATRNIEANTPSGGEKNLALEMVEAGKGANVARAASGATLGAPNALAALAGQGVSESISAAGTGVSGYSAGNQGLASLGGLEMQGRQIEAEQKGNVLGTVGSLAGSLSSGLAAAF